MQRNKSLIMEHGTWQAVKEGNLGRESVSIQMVLNASDRNSALS